MCLAPQDKILEAADLLHALLMAEQQASHFDRWFAVYMIPIIHPAGHYVNPIIITNNSQSSMGSSESGYDSMPNLEYPLSPLYIPRSPEVWSDGMEEGKSNNAYSFLMFFFLYNLEYWYSYVYFVE